MRISNRDYRLKADQLACVQDICMSASFSNAFEKYILNSRFIPHVSFVMKCDSAGLGVDLYEPLAQIPSIREQLHTPFNGERVFLLNRQTVSRWIATGDAIVFTERCISFDTQTISYLHRYRQGKTASLPDNFIDVVQLMKLGRIGADYIPYTTENLLFSTERREIVLDTLTSFEKIFYDEKSERACRRAARKALGAYDRKLPFMEGEIQGLWRKVYAVLMEIVKIQMMRPTQSIERKMKDLCAFMDESLGLVMHPELILAKRFFEKGRKLAFFDKIQRGREDIIEVVRNMTWDLFHLRMLELDCLVLISSRADFFIPYMFTYDKRLLQIRDCYMIDAMAINRKGFERFPFYTHIDEVLPFVQELSAPERYKLRRARNLEMDLPRFIGECERKLRDAMK